MSFSGSPTTLVFMFPFLNLHFIKIPMYGLSIAAGIFTAALVSWLLIKNDRKYMDFLITAAMTLAFGMTGAKILFILVSVPLKDFFPFIFRMLFTKGNPGLGGGFVFYGGLILGPAGYFLGCKIAGIHPRTFVKLYFTITPLVHGFGRIGCFLGGCCYGILYEGPFKVIYHNPITTVPEGVGIFPVQLLEALLVFAIFAAELILYKKTDLHPVIYTGSYCLIRFVLEYLRYDSERGTVGIFSTSQFISIIGLAGCFIYILIRVILNIKEMHPYKYL